MFTCRDRPSRIETSCSVGGAPGKIEKASAGGRTKTWFSGSTTRNTRLASRGSGSLYLTVTWYSFGPGSWLAVCTRSLKEPDSPGANTFCFSSGCRQPQLGTSSLIVTLLEPRFVNRKG